MVKCRYCKKEIDKNSAYKVGKATYYCNELCYKSSKNQKESKYQKRLPLTDYIQKIYVENGYDKKDINWGMIVKQIENIIKDNPKFTYGGMKYTLWYMYELCEDDLFSGMNGSILDLVPYKYKEARGFYIEKTRIKNLVEDFDTKDNVVIIEKKEKIIHIDNFDDI